MTFIPAATWEGRIDTEEGPDASRWHQKVSGSIMDNSGSCVGLLGFASDAGVRRNKGRLGAAQGPSALRRQLANMAWHGSEDLSVLDFGTVVVDGDALESGQEELASKIAESLPLVRRLLVIGGGHETAWGSFSGLARLFDPSTTRIGIINLDAHFDLRMTGEQGPSSGTPFAQIAEQFGQEAFHYCCLGLARTGNTRSLFKRADQLGVSYREDRDMRVSDIPEVLEQIRTFCRDMDMIYLTIDLDVLPHYQAPGVSAPAARGVALEVVEAVIDEVENIAQSLPNGMPLVEISELNPEFDESGVTAKTAALLAGTLLCPNRRQ